jgi:hypothetical protein
VCRLDLSFQLTHRLEKPSKERKKRRRKRTHLCAFDFFFAFACGEIVGIIFEESFFSVIIMLDDSYLRHA